jgi:hypothetical protein
VPGLVSTAALCGHARCRELAAGAMSLLGQGPEKMNRPTMVTSELVLQPYLSTGNHLALLEFGRRKINYEESNRPQESNNAHGPAVHGAWGAMPTDTTPRV